MPGIEEDIIPTLEPQGKTPMHVIPNEGETLSPDFFSENSPELTYLKKYADADTSAYDRALNALKKLDIS